MSKHRTVYSHELRLLLCVQCGAPIEAELAGGVLRCRYCQASMQIVRRVEEQELAAARAAPTMTEAQRFERLRAQDFRPMAAPLEVMALLVDGVLPPVRLPEALAAWFVALQEVRTIGGFAAAERLFHLTLVVHVPLLLARDERKLRALLENAVDVLTEPRHRHVLRGVLARAAARGGDRAAAEEWLAPIPPYSDDIHIDTACRFTRAYLSTCHGDFATVLRVLGTRAGEVPIAEGSDAICQVLRANALERLGQVAVANHAILALACALGAPGVVALIDANRELALCPMSSSIARDMARAADVRCLPVDASGLHAGATAVLGLATAIGLGIANLIARGHDYELSPEALIGTFVAVAPLALVILSRPAWRRFWLKRGGVRVRALVLLSAPPRRHDELATLHALTLRVALPAKHPYTARLEVAPSQAVRLRPGDEVDVLVDPEALRAMILAPLAT